MIQFCRRQYRLLYIIHVTALFNLSTQNFIVRNTITQPYLTVKVIEIEEIVKFIDGFSRPLIGSKQILDSGYLQKVGIDSETSEDISIRGICLRVHKPSEVVSIQTRISKPFPGSVIDAKCTCIAGNLGKCKHVVAVLRHVKRSCDIDSWSCTDGAASWSKEVKKAQEAIAVPIPLTEFCHGIEKTTQIFPQIQNFFQSEIFKVMIEKLPKDCAFLKELRGRAPLLFVDGSIIKKLVHRDLAPLTQFHLNAPPELAEFYKRYIVIPNKEAERVCSETVTQAKSDLWHVERQLRVTGCRAYDLFTYSIANHTNEEWADKLEYIYFPTFRGNWATDYGKRNEGKVLKLYSQKMNVEVFRCGLVINSTLPIFAFTPDGIVVSSSLPSRFLEVKCPTSGQQLSSDELLEKLDYIKIDPSNGTPVLKETHSYYGQIQFGLYLGGVQDADLIIYCERDQDVIVIPVTLNLSFAEEMMFVLRRTFFTNVLPYLFVCRNRLRKELKQVTS